MTSQLDANTYGIGQLITQRKMFIVPEHQRTFAWSVEMIEQYLEDIANAKESDAAEYFIGLIVLQGPIDTAWQILDGQQRLATTTMIYSAIREWLSARGLTADSAQIEGEFIGVRQLGGKYSPRLRLNTDNRETFDQFITRSMPESELSAKMSSLPKRSSNYRLLEGALFCRKWISEYATKQKDVQQQAQFLFSLASFIENRVKVVCVEVGTTTDAYILFESLNDRGADLSALDLVKNYIFSQLRTQSVDSLREKWARMVDNIEDKDADDFLKVFWTSQFGVIQKLQLFDKLQKAYPTSKGAERLISDLAIASERFAALDDPEHEIWKRFGSACRQRVSDLRVLGNRQSRPLILGALARFSPPEFERLMWLLVVTIVRYQIIGRGRTGIMEKEFSELAKRIHSGEVASAESAHLQIKSLLSTDDSFRSDFAKHSETKGSRVRYFLLELEACARATQKKFSREDYQGWRGLAETVSPEFVMPIPAHASDEQIALYYRLGNRMLIEDALTAEHPGEAFVPTLRTILDKSSIGLTKELALEDGWGGQQIEARGQRLADLAVNVWAIPRTLPS